jgi:probable F420-dependent oxidoreductase
VVAKIELGSFGAVVGPGEGHAFVDAAVELEELGYDTIWLTGGPLADLAQITEVVRATRHARVATGILSVDRFAPDDVAALYTDLEASHPGRFVVGLGGAHGPKPVPTLTAYLDRLDAVGVPATSRVMAALGPRMLDLSRERAAGALPVLVTPDYTVDARTRLGDDTALAVEQILVIEADPDRARTIARQPLGFLSTVPAYRSSFRRMGFTDEEITGLADRLVDAVVAWGDIDAVAAHLRRHVEAGADHIAISPATGSADQPLDEWRRLAEHLHLGSSL